MKLYFFRGLWSKIKKIRIGDILQVLIVATIALVIATIISPQLIGPTYGAGKLPIYAYFDTFVRYGVFIFIYFTLIPVLVLWLGKKVFKKIWSWKVGVLLLAVSLAGLTAIYFILPGPLHGNPLNISWLAFLTGPSPEKTQKITETGQEFCGERIDFLYSPSCVVNKLTPTLETIKNDLEQKGSGEKFYVWCVAGEKSPCKTAENVTCEAYERGEYTPEDVTKLYDDYGLTNLPALVLGCKYNLSGEFELEDYKRIICEKLGECDL